MWPAATIPIWENGDDDSSTGEWCRWWCRFWFRGTNPFHCDEKQFCSFPLVFPTTGLDKVDFFPPVFFYWWSKQTDAMTPNSKQTRNRKPCCWDRQHKNKIGLVSIVTFIISTLSRSCDFIFSFGPFCFWWRYYAPVADIVSALLSRWVYKLFFFIPTTKTLTYGIPVF